MKFRDFFQAHRQVKGLILQGLREIMKAQSDQPPFEIKLLEGRKEHMLQERII